MLVPVYDIKNCGPRHRFVANGKLVHNSDGINLQNLPARGGTELKACIEAPPGYVMIDCDSSNIEARVLAWLAEQNDLVTDFANKVDVYCKMASRIYGRNITKADKSERFVGKTVTLGCGYRTGALKLQATLKTANPPMHLEEYECQRIIDIYRSTYPRIKQLWYQGDQCIEAMHANKARWFGKKGVVQIEGRKGVRLPSGLYISYPQLHKAVDPKHNRTQWQYKDDTGIVGIYDGKLTENIVQALARIIVMSQLIRISRKLRVALTVHDSIIALAREDERDEARAFVESCMRWVPPWAEGLPVNCESKWGYNYGELSED